MIIEIAPDKSPNFRADLVNILSCLVAIGDAKDITEEVHELRLNLEKWNIKFIEQEIQNDREISPTFDRTFSRFITRT